MPKPALLASRASAHPASGQTYQQAVLALSPSLYWDLAANGATDLSAGSHSGTGQGGISIGGYSGSPITGESLATDFDGSNDYVLSSYNPCVNGTVRTYMGWANEDALTGGVLMGGDSGVSLWFGTTAGGNIQLYPRNNAGVTWVGTHSAATWFFWVLVFDESADSSELFINGISKTAKSTTDAYSTSGNLSVGAYFGGQNPFNGKMAHVAVFESGLTGPQIANLYDIAT